MKIDEDIGSDCAQPLHLRLRGAERTVKALHKNATGDIHYAKLLAARQVEQV